MAREIDDVLATLGSIAVAFSVAVVAALICLGLAGCGPRAEAVTADAVAAAVNAAAPALLEAERTETLDAVDGATRTRDAMRAAAARVRERWDPIWQAHEALREAHGAWARQIEAGAGGADAEPVRRAWCVMASVVGARADLPAWPGGCRP